MKGPSYAALSTALLGCLAFGSRMTQGPRQAEAVADGLWRRATARPAGNDAGTRVDNGVYRLVFDGPRRRYLCLDRQGREGLNKITVETFLATKQGACADLGGGVNLLDADLRGADLRAARLVGAYLDGAYLNGARLEGADLRGAGMSLDGFHLNGAILDGWTRLPSGMDMGRADRLGMILTKRRPAA